MSQVMQHNDVSKRFETHRSKTLSLYVTRQNQKFQIANDVQLSDIELVRAAVELVGEPGFGLTTQVGRGTVTGASYVANTNDQTRYPGYCSTINRLYTINESSSTVAGILGPNGISHKTNVNHGWANIQIKGLTHEAQAFVRDDTKTNNIFDLAVPTDHGLLSARIANNAATAPPFKLEKVRLEPQLVVNTSFFGEGTQAQKLARFVEDFADTDVSTYRNADGTVKYYVDAAPGTCQIPANCVTAVMLQFTVKPTSII